MGSVDYLFNLLFQEISYATPRIPILKLLLGRDEIFPRMARGPRPTSEVSRPVSFRTEYHRPQSDSFFELAVVSEVISPVVRYATYE
jgi:hypothetical protein